MTTIFVDAVAPRRNLVVEFFASIVRRIREYNEIERIRDELRHLNVRELADFGISRSDIPDLIRNVRSA